MPKSYIIVAALKAETPNLEQFLRLKILQGYDYLKQLFLILYLGSVFLPKFA